MKFVELVSCIGIIAVLVMTIHSSMEQDKFNHLPLQHTSGKVEQKLSGYVSGIKGKIDFLVIDGKKYQDVSGDFNNVRENSAISSDYRDDGPNRVVYNIYLN